MQKINKNGFESYLYVYVRVHSETASGRKENGWAAEQVCVCAHLSAPLAPECSCSSSAPLRSETVAATWQSAQAAKRHKYQQSDLETFCSNITYTTLCFSLSIQAQATTNPNLRSSQASLCTSHPGLCLSKPCAVLRSREHSRFIKRSQA